MCLRPPTTKPGTRSVGAQCLAEAWVPEGGLSSHKQPALGSSGQPMWGPRAPARPVSAARGEQKPHLLEDVFLIEERAVL